MSDPTVPELEIMPERRSPLRNLSVVWLVPLLAIMVTLGVAWKNYADRGTLILLNFPEASGISAGETTLRYRDVIVGLVESVGFSDDMATVQVHVRIDKQVAPTIPADAQFWVVEPEVSTRGISGLSTVLSGVYIEGAWVPTKDSQARTFGALPNAPTVRPGREGTRIVLRAPDGSQLTAGAPVFYRGIEVGRLEDPVLNPAGDGVIAEAFIQAPHDARITTATRFWDTSGFSVNFGPGGLSLNVASLSSLLNGGVAFETVFSGGAPISDQTSFDLFPDEASARDSIFTSVGANAVSMSILFDGSVSGLASGAVVEYRGIQVGQVTTIGAFIDQTPAAQVVRLRTIVAIEPQSLGLPAQASTDDVIAFLEQAVDGGLRARLATTSIFSAALKIELVDLPEEPKRKITTDKDGIPILPSVDSTLPDFTATAEGVLERINGLPIEEVMKSAISLMNSVEAIARSEGTRAAPDALVGLLNDTRTLVNNEATQALPAEIRQVVNELGVIVADLQKQGMVDRLIESITAAEDAADSVTESVIGVPELVQDLRDLTAKVNALKAEELVAAATGLLESSNKLIDSDETRSIPPALTAALKEVQAALSELREGGAVTNTNAALESARRAADAVAGATESLPALVDRMNQLVSQAGSLVASYGSKSSFSTETLDTLRDVQAAARAVAQLARTIERNPNSLLIGR